MSEVFSHRLFGWLGRCQMIAGSVVGVALLVFMGCVMFGDGDRPDVRITVIADGEVVHKSTCDRPQAGCEKLIALLASLRPQPQEICTDQYGDDRVALVEGRVLGERYSVRVSRENGCAISRWDRAGAAGLVAP